MVEELRHQSDALCGSCLNPDSNKQVIQEEILKV